MMKEITTDHQTRNKLAGDQEGARRSRVSVASQFKASMDGKAAGALCAQMDAELPESYCTAAKLKPTPSTYALALAAEGRPVRAEEDADRPWCPTTWSLPSSSRSLRSIGPAKPATARSSFLRSREHCASGPVKRTAKR